MTNLNPDSLNFGIGPDSDGSTVQEGQNEVTSGLRQLSTRYTADSGRGRQATNPDFHRGMFAVMMTMLPSKKEFCEGPDCVALRNEGMELLGIPLHLSDQFNKRGRTEKMFSMMKATTSSGEEAREAREGTGEEDRSINYVRDLQGLAKLREDAGGHNH